MTQRTFIIAEAGSCHDGSYANALRLIKVAKEAGADACKFQYWSDPKRLAERRHADEYFPIYSRYQMPEEWLPKLKRECDANGIEFMCTVYLPEDIEVIASLVQRFKVASFEAGDREFVRAHGKYEKQILMSVGMTGENDFPWYPGVVTYLHCVSAYPTPFEEANLRAIKPPLYGYSDHTHHVLTGAFAVCAGARILEVHFRLHTTDPVNPDYATALNPRELGEYITLVRQAETMLGDGIKRPQPAETEMMRYRVRP